MKLRKFFFLLVTILSVVSLCLAGCGGSGGSGTSSSGSGSTVTGTASKGPINGGNVAVYEVNLDGSKGRLVGTATTGADGSYSVNLGTYQGNVLVEITGGSYKDEATGTTVDNTTTLRAAKNDASGSVTIAVTPMTEIAVQHMGTNFSSSNITAANTIVSNMIGGVNILDTLPIDPTNSSSSSITQAQKDYSLILAAISQMVKDGSAASVNAAISSIANDLSDQKLNSTGTTLSTALSAFIGSSNNQTGVTSSSTTLVQSLNTAATTEIPSTSGSGTSSSGGSASSPTFDWMACHMYIYVYKGDYSTTPYGSLPSTWIWGLSTYGRSSIVGPQTYGVVPTGTDAASGKFNITNPEPLVVGQTYTLILETKAHTIQSVLFRGGDTTVGPPTYGGDNCDFPLVVN